MNLDKKLEQNGIFPDEELKVDKKIEIAKFVAQGLCDNFKEFADMYNEFYMRIYNCKFYYAQIDSKFNGVFYYYKNNAIYISKDKQIDEYLVHEVIHYIQNFSKVQGNEKKAGLCEFEDYRILALGINEAMVQYITSKIMGEEVLRRNFESMSIMTNSPDRYKFLASLAYQITYFVDEGQAVKSSLKSDSVFTEKLYNTYEDQTEKILKKFDEILEENNKPQVNNEKVSQIYLEVQEILYTVYFNKMIKYVATTKEIDEQVEKIENYENIIGKDLNNDKYFNNFLEFKSKMETRFLKEYVEMSRKQSKRNLPVAYKNVFQRIFDKIARIFKVKKVENK